MNLIGHWRSEDQTIVGERERKVYEEKKNFAGKVKKSCKQARENGNVGGFAANGYRGIPQSGRKTSVDWRG